MLVPFFQDCAVKMGADAESIREAVALCPTGPAAPTSTATAVLLFSAKCPPGVVLDSCIPNCDESTNGDVLLLNQDGSDMRLLCEMQNFLFSWIGAAATPALMCTTWPGWIVKSALLFASTRSVIA